MTKHQVTEHEGPGEKIPPEKLADLPTEAGREVASPSANLPQVMDYGRDAGIGVESVGADELKIPILRILQGLSPQVKPPAAGGIAGATVGMIFNTATKEMWDVSEASRQLLTIPVFRDHNVLEYIPRDLGGGFVAMHDAGYELLDLVRAVNGRFAKQPVLAHAAWEEMFKSMARARKLPKGVSANAIPVGGRPMKWEDATALYREINPKGGTELVDTFYLYMLLQTPDGMLQRDVVTFSSTQIDTYTSFMTRYTGLRYPNSQKQMIQPPLWAHRLRLGTVYTKKKKGEFYGWLLRLDTEPPLSSRMRLDDPLYKMAREFYDLMKSGAAKADVAADIATGGAAEEDEEIPF
jgi:hypothetical protein